VQAEIDAAGAQFEGGPAGQKCGADHRLAAAEDAGAAKAALVRVASAGLQALGKVGTAETWPSGRQFGVGDIEIGYPNLAAVVGAVGRQQAGLGANEGDGVAGAYARTLRHGSRCRH
jgi:hypothetical protein